MTSKWLPYREIAKKLGLTDSHTRHKIKAANLQPYHELGENGCKLYNIDECLKLELRPRNKCSAELLSRPEICKRLKISKVSLNNYITRSQIKGFYWSESDCQESYRGKRYRLGDIATAIEARKNQTFVAKQTAAETARKAYAPMREICKSPLTLDEKIIKLRSLGLKAGKIAKLCNTTIPKVWEVIKKDGIK